jgi:hypothetical protein
MGHCRRRAGWLRSVRHRQTATPLAPTSRRLLQRRVVEREQLFALADRLVRARRGTCLMTPSSGEATTSASCEPLRPAPARSACTGIRQSSAAATSARRCFAACFRRQRGRLPARTRPSNSPRCRPGGDLRGDRPPAGRRAGRRPSGNDPARAGGRPGAGTTTGRPPLLPAIGDLGSMSAVSAAATHRSPSPAGRSASQSAARRSQTR